MAQTNKPLLAWVAMGAGIVMFLVFMFPQLWAPVTPGMAGLRLAVLLVGLAVFAAGLATYNRWSLEKGKGAGSSDTMTTASSGPKNRYVSPSSEAETPTIRGADDGPDNRPAP